MTRTMCLTVALTLSTTVAASRLAEASGSDPAPRSYTLEQAMTDALASHPLVRGAVAEETAADARIDEATTGLLPDVGVSAQLNRSTRGARPGGRKRNAHRLTHRPQDCSVRSRTSAFVT